MSVLGPATNSHHSPASGGDPRLTTALEEYRALLEAGERPDRAAFLARHADLGPALAECLAGLELVHAAAPALSASHTSALDGQADDPLIEPLGDFRIVREVGRGGMGVVYEAEQRSLGRRVALKVLPFAATMDPRQLQRFQNEARAAASLEHPHIVPVYGVGCERGVHYYAMKFIEGQSLADMLAAQRQASEPRPLGSGESAPLPDGRSSDSTACVAGFLTLRAPRDAAAFRQIAEWGIQAAEALEHAHSVGIVHRDIKPANLMIDSNGSLWVTDFGLARTAADAGLTMTGDVLGTLRYMSPEQALAKHGLVDHRTDVYSLGVTLYELLTGTPAVSGKDREEILNAITLDEPRPPRTLDAAIPKDLETIVLKATEKAPGDRYATAQDLRDDLRRWLESKPIQARRSGAWERMRKWVRRRPTLAALVAVSTAAVMLLVGVLLWHNAKLQAAANREHQQAEQASQERDSAREQRRQARKAVDDMYTDVAQKWLDQQAGLTEVQRDFLLKALRYYQEFVQDEDPDPDLRRDKAWAFIRVAEIQKTLGKLADSEAAQRRAIALWEQLAAEFPAYPEYQREVARSRRSIAMAVFEQGRSNEALELFQQAVADCEKLAANFKGEAMYRRELGAACLSVSIVFYRLEQKEKAAAFLNRAAEVYERLNEQFPDAPLYREDLMLVYDFKASLGIGGLENEASARQQAAEIGEKLMNDFTNEPRYRDTLVMVYNNWTDTLMKLNRLEEAEEVNRKAMKLAERLATDFPHILEHRKQLARCHERVGNLFQARGEFEEAKKHLRKAVDTCPDVLLLDTVAGSLLTFSDPRYRDPAWALEVANKAVQAQPEWASVRSTRALAHYRLGDAKAALADLEKAREFRKGANDSSDIFILPMVLWKLGEKEKARREYETASQWMDKNLPREKGLWGIRAEAAALLGLPDPTPPKGKEGSPRKDK
jgi:serine/threonine protein kinase